MARSQAPLTAYICRENLKLFICLAQNQILVFPPLSFYRARLFRMTSLASCNTAIKVGKLTFANFDRVRIRGPHKIRSQGTVARRRLFPNVSQGSGKTKGLYTKPLRRLNAPAKVRFLNMAVVIGAKAPPSIVRPGCVIRNYDNY
jgi:hypothetical protein